MVTDSEVLARHQCSLPEVSLEEKMDDSAVLTASDESSLPLYVFNTLKQESLFFVSVQDEFVFPLLPLYYFTPSRHKSLLKINHFSLSKGN